MSIAEESLCNFHVGDFEGESTCYAVDADNNAPLLEFWAIHADELAAARASRALAAEAALAAQAALAAALADQEVIDAAAAASAAARAEAAEAAEAARRATVLASMSSEAWRGELHVDLASMTAPRLAACVVYVEALIDDPAYRKSQGVKQAIIRAIWKAHGGRGKAVDAVNMTRNDDMLVGIRKKLMQAELV